MYNKQSDRITALYCRLSRDDGSEGETKQFSPTNLDVTDEEVGAIDLSDLSDFLDDDDDKY